MLPFELFDHVYSSVGGYRTLYAHEVLDEDTLAQLERWAQLWTELGDKKTQLFSRPFNDYWLFGKVFPAGVDHAGRPRACVHSILAPYHRIEESCR